MGLLDSILGGMVGGAMRRGGMGGLGGLGRRRGRSGLVMALLPIVLNMLANKRGGRGMPGFGGGMGAMGGLGALASLGGLGALLQQFQQKGYGEQVQSWVSTDQNQPIPPDAVGQVFDHDELTQIASQAGVSEEEAREGLSELLPQVVDQLTPQGQLPNFDQLSASLEQFQQELQQHGGS